MATTAGLDVNAVRARFSALSREHEGRPIAYLDGPGGSQVPDEVTEAVARYLRGSNANLGGPFATSVETDAIVEEGRVAGADFVGGDPSEIAFGPNMTTLNYLLAHAVARTLRPGDEIVVTELDHDANVSPWLQVAADHGLDIHTVRLRPADCTLDVDAVSAAIGPRTRIVACTLASNGVGTIPDARSVAGLAHSVGALAWFDGVHYAPHRRIDVASLGADVLICSAYKFCGPHYALAWARRELLERWPADRVRPADETPPGHRFETGTQSHEAIAGTTAAIDYLASLGDGDDRRARLDSAFARTRAHEEALMQQMLAGLEAIDGVRLLGITDAERIGERTATFTVTVNGVEPRAVCEALWRDHSIAAWDGNYYALGVMEALGLEGRGGATRLGLLHYSTAEEVDRALAGLAAIAAG